MDEFNLDGIAWEMAFPNLSLHKRIIEAKKLSTNRSDSDSFIKSCHTLIHLVSEASSKREGELAEKTYKFLQRLISNTEATFT